MRRESGTSDQETHGRPDYDLAEIDSVGNVVGRIGNGKTIIHFDGHMDTVQVNDADQWQCRLSQEKSWTTPSGEEDRWI